MHTPGYRYLVLPETLEYLENENGPDKTGRKDGGGESRHLWFLKKPVSLGKWQRSS